MPRCIDLHVTTEGSNAGKIGSYSDNFETGSVTFANMESIMLSGGFGQEDFALMSEGYVVASGTMGDDEITVSSGSVIVTINGDSSTFSGSDVVGIVAMARTEMTSFWSTPRCSFLAYCSATTVMTSSKAVAGMI